MMTVFSIPKSFTGTADLSQQNAVLSWLKLEPSCEVMLFGDDAGVQEFAERIGARWMGVLPRNSMGTPLLAPAFERAAEAAAHDTLCYVNADIILLNDFPLALGQLKTNRYLAVGQRIDMDITSSIIQGDGATHLQKESRQTGVLHGPNAMDFFVFPREQAHLYRPPFAVGRPGWDNWMVLQARSHGVNVVDLTQITTVIHQNHDHRHVVGMAGPNWQGPEAEDHLALLGSQAYHCDIWDSTHVLTHKGVRSAWGCRYWFNRCITEVALICQGRKVLKPIEWCCGKARAVLNIARTMVGVGRKRPS